MRFVNSILAGLLAAKTLVTAQSIDPNTLPECARVCLDNMQAKFGDFLCASTEDFDCLCRASDWRLGLAECSKANCEGGEGSVGYQQVTAYANEKCAIVTGAPIDQASSTSSVSEPKTVIPSSETLETATEVAPTISSESVITSVSASSIPTTLVTTTSTEEDATATSSQQVLATSATGGSSLASDDGNNGSSSEDESENRNNADDADDNDKEGNLALGTKIGIGVAVGVAAAVIMAALIAFLRNRSAKKQQLAAREKDMQISSPMPGSGRSFASIEGSGKKNLELTSTRYENMVPRTQPRVTEP